jgi:hypothetical protein
VILTTPEGTGGGYDPIFHVREAGCSYARMGEHLRQRLGSRGKAARELAPGGWFIAALPASEQSGPHRRGLYAEVAADMNVVLAQWVGEGRIAQATADALVVPVWMRTPEEIRAPFDDADGSVDGLVLESVELFHLDNPYWDDDPQVFAEEFMRSCLAWGRPLFEAAFAREGDGGAHHLDDFLAEVRARVAAAPDRHRWDYLEALVVCRKA